MMVEMEHYAQVPLFKGLPPDDIMRLLKTAKDVVAHANDVIVREGDAGDGFFVIAKGAFEVRKRRASRDGDAAAGESDGALLAKLGEFSFFGEMSLVTYAPRAATVVCVEEGRLKKFPTEAFERLLAAGDLAAHKVIRNMCTILAERLARMGERFVAAGPA
jgi:cAMP-dependent protein kinase regulator